MKEKVMYVKRREDIRNGAKEYLKEEKLIAANDKLYGAGASEYMGKAYQYYFQKKTEE